MGNPSFLLRCQMPGEGRPSMYREPMKEWQISCLLDCNRNLRRPNFELMRAKARRGGKHEKNDFIYCYEP